MDVVYAVGSWIAENWLTAAVAVVGGASAISQYQTTKAQGKAAQIAANMQAADLETVADQKRALATIEAQRIQSAARKTEGRATALLASSGFASGDGTSSAILDDITKQASIEELLSTAQYFDSAAEDDRQAAQVRAGGRYSNAAAQTSAVTTFLSGASDWASTFAVGGGTATNPNKGRTTSYPGKKVKAA